MHRIFSILISTKTTLVVLLLFAIAMATATFVENDFGTQTARAVIYNSWWFEMLMVLLGINFAGNIFRYGLLRRSKFPILLFHLAFIVILIGAGITRYLGFEGIMRLREGESSNVIISESNYVQFEFSDKTGSLQSKKEAYFSPIQKNHFHSEVMFENREIIISYVDFIADASQRLVENLENGSEVLEIVLSGEKGMVSQYLHGGETKSLKNSKVSVSFNKNFQPGINIWSENGTLKIRSDQPIDFFDMALQQGSKLAAHMSHQLQLNALYKGPNFSFVPVKYLEKGEVKWISQSKKPKDNSDQIEDILELEISTQGNKKKVSLPYKHGYLPSFQNISIEGIQLSIGYGAIPVYTDFSLHLRDFELEKYPGSTSPSSYASEVTIIDKDLQKDYRIYMNHVLDYKGHRFFQASYDSDEKGSVLAVNRDRIGTWVTYLGYLLMGLGMFLTLFAKGSRFHLVLGKLNQLKQQTTIVVLFSLMSFGLLAQNQNQEQIELQIIDRDQASDFGRLMVQDLDGRIKPVNTLASEFLRKVSRRTQLDLNKHKINADQVFLAMHMDPASWSQTPMIKVDYKKLGNRVEGLKSEKKTLLSLEDFVNEQNQYLLEEFVKAANEKKPGERNEFDNEILTVDERFNVVFNVLSGNYLRIFPKKDDPNNTWFGPNHSFSDFSPEDGQFAREILPIYYENLRKGHQSGNWQAAQESLAYIDTYQKVLAEELMPTEKQIQAELLYNKLNLNFWLFQAYFALGLLLLVFALVNLFKKSRFLTLTVKLSVIMAILAFLIHSFNLILRWYIAEYPPWSNGYEMIVFVSWSLVLIGLIFHPKSDFSLPLALVFSGVLLFVSYLDWLNPEITSLMPVLKSYWLKIHVATIISSYAPLALSALLGILAQVLMIIRNEKNELKINHKLKEISYINELSMTLGLFVLSIGTFLGGIWANESWGRYWAWDPKETWALISIIIYAVVLHLRFVPKFNNLFTLNLASTLAFFSIIMTSFGVNYYLTGLHSYATGDPVPIPGFVYFVVVLISLIGIAAYRNYLKAEQKAHH